MLNDCVNCKQGLLMLICRPPLRTKWDNTSKCWCHTYINSWSLNNMGFNRVGPLICRYFLIVNTTVLQGWHWLNPLMQNHGYWERIPRADYKVEDFSTEQMVGTPKPPGTVLGSSVFCKFSGRESQDWHPSDAVATDRFQNIGFRVFVRGCPDIAQNFSYGSSTGNNIFPRNIHNAEFRALFGKIQVPRPWVPRPLSAYYFKYIISNPFLIFVGLVPDDCPADHFGEWP